MFAKCDRSVAQDAMWAVRRLQACDLVGAKSQLPREDCFCLKLHLRSIEELTSLLDRFLAFGETTTSIINASPILHREPPVPDAA